MAPFHLCFLILSAFCCGVSTALLLAVKSRMRVMMMSNNAAAGKAHPALQETGDMWHRDFNNRVRRVLHGKLPSRFEVAGSFPASKLSIGFRQYTHCDDRDRVLPTNYQGKQLRVQYFNTRDVKPDYEEVADETCEIVPLSTRLDAISNKLFRGYGALDKKFDQEMEGFDEASRVTMSPNSSSSSVLHTFNFKAFPLRYNFGAFKEKTYGLNANPVQVFIFDERNFEVVEEVVHRSEADRVELALRALLTGPYGYHYYIERDINKSIAHWMSKVIPLSGELNLEMGPKGLEEYYPTGELRRIKIRPACIEHQQAMDPQAVLVGNVSDAEYLACCRDASQYQLAAGKPEQAVVLDVPVDLLTSLSIGVVDDKGLSFVLKAPSIEARDEIVMWLASIVVEQLPIHCLESFKPVNRVNVSQYLAVAGKSWFGQGEQTVYNETVRKGMELIPSQFELKLAAPGALDVVMKKVQTTLFPCAKALYFRASKVAIYEPGGHFAAHRDTVRHSTHQASLLVEIPSEHTGGDLVLEMNDQRVEWSLAYKPKPRGKGRGRGGVHTSTESDVSHEIGQPVSLTKFSPRNVKFTAFYTDVKHSVQPVESGIRMVVQYDIFVEEGDNNEESSESSEGYSVPNENSADMYLKVDKCDNDNDNDDGDDDPYQTYFEKTSYFGDSRMDATLARAFAREIKSYVSDDQGLAFPLFHCYTSTRVMHKWLKASDRSVFLTLLKAGYCVQITPYLIDAASGEEGKFKEDDCYTMRPLPSVLTKSEKGYIMNERSKIVEVIVTANTDRKFTPRFPKRIVYASSGYEQTSQLENRPYTEYTGNEAGYAEHKYFAVAFVVTTRAAAFLNSKKK